MGRTTGIAAAVAAVAVSAAAQQRPSIDSVLDALDKVHTFSETAVSPDGTRIAWVEDLTPAGNGGPSLIYVRELPNGEPRLISAETTRPTIIPSGQRSAIVRRPPPNTLREHGIAWSPDGERLAFLSDAASPGQLQLYVWTARQLEVTKSAGASRAVSGSRFTQLTHAKGQLADPRWSPGGKQIAVLYVAGSSQATGALVAYKPDAGVVGDVIEEQRITIVDLAQPNTLREVSPANLFVYDYDWSPDGTRFAAEAVEGSGTNNYWLAQLYTVRADTGDAKSIWKPPLQIAVPRWSPDGKSIAVIHGIMSDEGSNGGDVFVVPAAGGDARDVTPGFEGSARSLTWSAGGEILINAYVDGRSALVSVGPSGGPRKTLWSAPRHVTALSNSARADVVAACVQSFTDASEVYAGPAGRWTKQTNINASIKPAWGDANSLHWSSDKYRVQGWLVYPANFDPSRKYPLVVSVHGGPSSGHFAAWPQRWNAVLPSQDYFVLLPNPRGSYGGGEAFTQANVKDFGYGDLRDILAGVDAAIKEAPIDPNRIGITGWSYGGYMTMWAVTQTSRFRAAVAGAGIANWQSYYGENRIDTWMLPFFGASVYDDPQVYARSSPITYIKQAKTPTLVLHGDRDSEVPTPQAYEFWHALKALGVPTELVIYPDEGHFVAKPEHQRDIERRMVAWFDRWLAP
jgi:dipeptidyl aminopeptidase/acylaminoacyl peptidase